jgi:DNA polymerase II large subunit
VLFCPAEYLAMPSKATGGIKFVKDKDGKTRIERVHRYTSVSDKIRKRKSQKSRPVSRSAASQMDLMLSRRGK